MDELRAVWERYVESWKVKSVAAKRKLYETCLSPSCIYTDPLRVAKGWDELTDHMVGFHGQFPGSYFITEEFLAHHGRSVARWRMVGEDGTRMGDGISYAEYDESGKLITMTGFFEPPGAPG